MNKVLLEDFEYILNSDLPWETLNHKKVFITGGTGFLGSLIIRFFDYINKKRNWNISIIALIRNEEKAKRIIGDCNVTLVKGDICQIPAIEWDIDFIFHCAAVTDSKTMVGQPVEVTEGIVQGTSNIMLLSRQKAVESVIYLSSMEVYGVNTKASYERTGEKDLGYIDLFNARSCYPMGKRMAENICFNYFAEYGVPVKIARLAQTFGAGVSKTDNRVFAQFARSAMDNEDIVLHTEGTSIGNYCYSADAILGMFFLLFKGENGHEYNIVNEETTMSIKEMASLVAEKITSGVISVNFDIPAGNKHGYAAVTNIRLSAEKIQGLGWEARFGMEEMYKRMIRSLLDGAGEAS
ncbi:NAD-dependent epimerase/dehydratase family protein [Paenibacillus typhae]|uniref:NAD-dependent epimerase/dehydratase family protein n=1 Tax=Paenibacillus typhae TaxID=1174501 RepID=UPI001C8DAC04|nr:NAD(P)-dependent oxidoreductase [Paenibacillus typhae]MBY0011665.1 NAD(P)-dependent oxidoreductase [Paenibacillus typhae]